MWFKHDPMNTVELAMKKHGWKYHRMDSRTILTGFGAPGHTHLVGIRHEEDKQTLLFLFHPSRSSADILKAVITGQQPFIRVHPAAGHTAEQVAQVCELLLQLNFEMALGSFERDQSDGEIRFRIALPYRDTSLTAEQVSWCLELGLASAAIGMQKIDAILHGEGEGARMEI
jgi:hypothetical protein